MAKLPTVFIVVPVFNRHAITLDFVTAMRRQSYEDIRLFVVDDRSPDGTAAILRERHGDWSKLTILNSGGNAWWGGGAGLGIAEVCKIALSDDCILLMNDDVKFPDYLVKELVLAHQVKPNAVLAATPVRDGLIVGPGSNMLFWPFAVTLRPYGNHKWPSKNLPAYIPIDFQFAHCTLYPIAIVRAIGNLAYKQLPHYHSDGEYSYRAVRAGFESYVVTSIPVFPKAGSTGLFNCSETRYNWDEFRRSFTEFKSINNIRHRWEFAKLTAPKIWLYPYFLSHILRDFLKSTLKISLQAMRKSNGP